MKAKLIIDGKELEVDISEAELKKLEEKPKKTGYERVMPNEEYYYVDEDGNVMSSSLTWEDEDESLYLVANCYSDDTVAENNARADKLMRELRRFAVEHRTEEVNYSEGVYEIYYDYDEQFLSSENVSCCKYVGGIPFNTDSVVKLAIDTFCDELIWYFTEYKDSL